MSLILHFSLTSLHFQYCHLPKIIVIFWQKKIVFAQIVYKSILLQFFVLFLKKAEKNTPVIILGSLVCVFGMPSYHPFSKHFTSSAYPIGQ